jgi:hypothetical protein
VILHWFVVEDYFFDLIFSVHLIEHQVLHQVVRQASVVRQLDVVVVQVVPGVVRVLV